MPSDSDLRNARARAITPLGLGTGETGVLLLHGYLATPEEMRGLAEHLAAAGLRAAVPLIAGHGTTLHEFRRTTWRDWYASAESALAELQAECTRAFVVGMSLGGLQALHLAAHHPELAGVVALAPAVVLYDGRRPWRRASDLKLALLERMPWLARLYPGESSDGTPHFLHADLRDEAARRRHIYYGFNPTSGVVELLRYARHLRPELERIRQPLLLLHSPLDNTVPLLSSQYVLAHVSSRDKALDTQTAARSWHVLTEDVDAPAVFAMVLRFIAERIR